MRVALAGPANRAGRLAGQHAATGTSAKMAAVLGTAIVRVFEYAVGMTGLSAKAATRAGLRFRCVTVVAGQHAGYFPGATPITLKLIYAADDGRVLGAQAIGKDGVDKRIDVIATAMAFNATVRELAGLDLSYAPPYGSAKDPVHQAAFAACNQLDGLGDLLDPDADLSGYQVVDVRTAAEITKAPLTGCTAVIAIPVDELRERLHDCRQVRRRTARSCGAKTFEATWLCFSRKSLRGCHTATPGCAVNAASNPQIHDRTVIIQHRAPFEIAHVVNQAVQDIVGCVVRL